MIGVLLVSHGELAAALLQTATEIAGPMPRVHALGFARHERVEDIRAKILAEISQMEEGAGVLVLADVFGGTCSNVVLGLSAEANGGLEVVAGMNLPMVLKLATAREETTDLRELAQLVKFFGQKHVVHASDVLRGHLT